MSKLQELIDTVSFLTGKPRRAVEAVTAAPEGIPESDGAAAASANDVSADELPEKKALD